MSVPGGNQQRFIMKGAQICTDLKIAHFDVLSVILGGILLGLSFPPVGWTLSAWVSFVPLFRICMRFSARNTFLLGWIFHVSMVAVAFYWPLLHLQLDTALISFVAMIALTMLLSVPFALAAAGAPTITAAGAIKCLNRIQRIRSLFLAGLLVFALDLILQVGPVPMPWLSLGNSQAMSGLVESLAPYIGSVGIGVLVLFVNMLIVTGIEFSDVSLSARTAVGAALPTMIMLTALLPREQPEFGDSSFKVGILQPGFPAQDWAQIQDLSRVDTLLALSDFVLMDADNRPELVIWPETALPYSRDRGVVEAIRQKLSSWAVDNQVAILSGAITESSRFADKKRINPAIYFRNTVRLFDTEGNVTDHGKNILVPFAEYVPFSLTFPGLASLSIPAGGVAGYLPEEAPSVFRTNKSSFGVMICFESVFPGYARSLARAESQFLVVITQDGWWKSDIPGIQHFYFSRFRAAETGLSVVQVSVDGISGVIQPGGSIQVMTGNEARRLLIVEVPGAKSETFYMRFGDLMLILGLGVWIAALLGSCLASRSCMQRRDAIRLHK